MNSDEKTPCERRFGMPFNGPAIPFGVMVEYHPFLCPKPVETPPIRSESLTWNVPRLCVVCGVNLERRHFGRRRRRIGADGRIWNPRPKAQCKGSVNANER